MKKKISLMLAVTMIFAFSAQSVGAVNVIMNSSFVSFPDQEPVVENGTTLVPIRPIAEKLGLEILWDDPTDTVTLKKGEFFIELVIGSNKVKTSSGEKELLTAPKIINSRTMVPLRFIAEELGLTVVWNNELQRVVIVGEVDTTVKAPIVKDEKPNETDGENATEKVENAVTNTEKNTEETTEAEEADENTIFAEIHATNSTLMFEVPQDYLPEDTDDEESYAFRTLDAVDVQHLYNWEKVTECAAFATADTTEGIVYVVRALDPYEGEEYDISSMNEALPEKPERPQFPEIDFGLMTKEMELAITRQIFVDMGVDVPENLEELETEEIYSLLGFETAEEFTEQSRISMENADFSSVTGYDEYLAYQDEYRAYSEEIKEYNDKKSQINAVKEYAARKISSLYAKASDEEWTKLFNERLNFDPEVRYDGLEIIKINDKPVIHATVYAEDPDDEQGVYEYYEYREDDCIVTIYGGTLFGSEAGDDIAAALSTLTIM